MKTIILFLGMLVAQVTILFAAEDIRSKTTSKALPLKDWKIDPDEKACGVPFGASESDFIKVHGKPTGYIQLTTNSSALIYGRDAGFVFQNGKLQAVRIVSSIVDWELANEYWDFQPEPKWRLSNGIYSDMNLQEVRRILGPKLIANNNWGLHSQYFATTNARVELNFSYQKDRESDESAYRLRSIYVDHGGGRSARGIGIFKPKGMVPHFSTAPAVRSVVDAVNRMASEITRLEIDPDKEIYGVRLGATEDELIKEFDAPPTGYLRLNSKDSAILYGQAHAFLFSDGKLIGVRISNSILDWELANNLDDTTKFSTREWCLNNGIKLEMNALQVKELLGDKLMQEGGSRYSRYYLTEKSRVKLNFSHYTSEGEGENAYKIHSIMIRPISNGKQGDPLNRFLSSVDADAGESASSSSFGGIGATMNLNKTGEMEIISVIAGLPAAKAGLTKGTIVHAVDGISTKDKELSEVIALVRGVEGTKVKLDVFDPDKNSRSIVELTRAKIAISEGSTRSTTITTDRVLRAEATDGAVALIQFFRFSMDSDKGEDTATYRWRFKSSSSSPVETGTNTAVFRYTRTQTGSNTYDITAKGDSDAKLVKVGTFRLDWSYGYTNRGYIYPKRASDKVRVVDATQFETGP